MHSAISFTAATALTLEIDASGIQRNMGNKTDVWQGTLALMVLKTLETMGPQHGYGIARRIEQTSGQRCSSTTARSTPRC